MRKASVEGLRVKDLRHVLLPLKRGRMLKDYVDVGFDTEFTPEPDSADRELLSLQFSLGKGATSLYYINRVEGISSGELLEYALKFLNENNAAPTKHIFLIVHFGIAELSKISDFYDEYEKTVDERIVKVRPKVSQFNKAIRWEKNFGDVALHIADLFGHMKTSLEKVGASLGYQKLKIDVDGKDHSYWITHMKELSVKHRGLFEEYAKRDAEITIIAWRKLIETYKPLNLDPHIYATYTSLAIASFRRSMKTLPCKTAVEKVLIKQKLKGERWYEHIAKKVVYDDDLNMRVMAALSYWGGNNQAFVRGYYPHIDGTYHDFISLYIIAGILQPLSNELTAYKQLTLDDVKCGAEGFCQVDFEFPDAEQYPCLPVQEDFYAKLMFPLKGESYCTCSELRQALSCGVNIQKFKGYGFVADENEIEHDLKPFLLSMLKKKTELDVSGKAKSIEREIEKSKMVGVIGRLAYMKPSRTAEDITKFLHVSGMKSAEFREYGQKKAIRELTERSEVGGTWHIEWASLILGKARSLASWAVRQGEKCLSISTDGGFWLGNPHFENTELHKQLAEFHSGVRFEGSFSELWIARNRLYVAWKDNGEVLHSAMGGVAASGAGSEKSVNFEKMVRESLDAGKQVYCQAETKRLTGLSDYMFKGTPLNSEEVKVKKMSWKPDYKRKLVSDVNVFKDCTDTKPYETVAEAFRQVYGIGEKAGRQRKLDEEQIQQIKGEPWSLSNRELAKKYGVGQALIDKIRRGQT